MAPWTAVLLSALAATTCIRAIPTGSTQSHHVDDHHDDHDHSDNQDNHDEHDKHDFEHGKHHHGEAFKNFTEFEGWSTWRGYGVNLGGWLVIETSITPDIWINGGANVTDEWTFCQTVGKERCSPLLEEHYATFITNATIDKLATVNVNTVRIPSTYAAWVDVPGSELYHGHQLKYLRDVTDYAISTYGMHVIIDLHSLPGGVNSLEIGEAFGHSDWWYNSTNFDYSLQAIDGVLDFIHSSVAPNQFTIAPINEPCESIGNFATPQAVSYPDGTNYVTAYMKAVYAKMQAVNPNLWLMQNDGFAGASRWTPYWNTTDKWMLDVHIYYFPVEGVQGASIPGLICQEAIGRIADGFNVFVGEFSLQARLNNTLDGRQAAYESQVRAFQQYLSGGTFWTARFDGYRPVNGEGTQNDYWGVNKLIDDRVIRPFDQINTTRYCLDDAT